MLKKLRGNESDIELADIDLSDNQLRDAGGRLHGGPPIEHVFLLRAAELLHQYGTPAYRLEAVMTNVAQTLGVPSVILYTPTALVVAFGEGEAEKTYLRRVHSSDIDIAKLLQLDEILEQVEDGEFPLAEAMEEMEKAASAPSVFSIPFSAFASAVACSGIAVIFGGSLYDTAIAAIGGCLLFLVTVLLGSRGSGGWLEPFLGFSTAVSVAFVGQWLPIDERLVTLAALILPIPGLTLTVAITELAVRHLSSGSARLAGALVTLFTLVVGVAIGWRLTAGLGAGIEPLAAPLPEWSIWLVVAISPFAFSVVFKAPVSQWPYIAAVVVAGFLANQAVGTVAGNEVAAFAGAFVVGCGSNAYARLRNRPAMIPQTPGLLILVPGSVGYNSLTAMIDNETIRGVELAFAMSITGVALVGGILLANQVLSPRRSL